MLFVWLSLVSVFAVELPQAPTEAEVRRWSAGEYNDHIVQIDLSAGREMIKLVDEMSISTEPTAMASFRSQMVERVAAHEVRLAAMPPYKGDAGFRDAIAEMFAYTRHVLMVDLPKATAIHDATPTTDAHVVELEELIVRMDREAEAAVVAVEEAQAAFAKRQQIRLVDVHEEPQLASERTPFVVDGLPPAGSTLDADVYVAFAMGYHNELVMEFDALWGVFNPVVDEMESNGAAFEKARLKALKEVRVIAERAATREAWQGDATLRDAWISSAQNTIGLLEGSLAEYGAINGKKRRSGKDFKQMNVLIDALNDGTTVVDREQNDAMETFGASWHFAAYEAWLAQLSAQVEAVHGN